MGTLVRRNAPNGEVPRPLRSVCVFVENDRRWHNTIKMGVCYNGAMTRALYYLQFLLLAGLWWLYRLMPVRWAYPIGWGVGAGAFSLFHRSKRAQTAIDNVLIAGITKSRAEAYRIARFSVGHFVGHVCEALRISDRVTKENWRDHVKLEMDPEVEKLVFQPTCPVILATGHLGAWEAGITAITSVRPFFAVARLMDNPFLQRFLNRHNFRGGATIIPKQRGFRGEAMRRWRNQNAALAILFDQHCSHGAPVPFFGHTVEVYTSPARLHLSTGAPILVGGFLRTGPLQYKMVAIGKPILAKPDLPHDEALRVLTAELIARFEQVIRMAPEQYLWIHRRFRGIPLPADVEP